jgi:hypothetical protein
MCISIDYGIPEKESSTEVPEHTLTKELRIQLF